MEEEAQRAKRLRRQAYDKWRWAKYYWENRDYERNRALRNYYRRKEERLRILNSTDYQSEFYQHPITSEDRYTEIHVPIPL